MTAQVAKITKNRAEILKMLWNREQTEVKSVVDSLHGVGVQKEKTLLGEINSIHEEYQSQIDKLQKKNRELEENLKKEAIFSTACVKDLRVQRKRIKKMEYASRKLGEANSTSKK
mgnify:CR=1 FL=1